MTNKRYIITGATSFLGVALCRELLKAGNTVVAVCRDGSNGEAKLPSGVEVVHAMMSEYGVLNEKINIGDVFINLAWDGTAKAQREDPAVQSVNVDNTLAAMKAASSMGCTLFVESGSQAEYGIINEKIFEDSPCTPISEYGNAKLRVKERGFDLCRELGLKYIHLRIFSLYGETDHPVTLIMSGLDKMLANEPLDMSPCIHKWNFLYVEDAARQIRLLCDNALSRSDFGQEVYHIASDDTRILRDFVYDMKDICQSGSDLRFGGLETAAQPSLDPDISKTVAATGFKDFQKFDVIIRKIIRIKRGNDNFIRRGIDFFLGNIRNKFIRFCFVGCLNAAFGYGVYCLSILFGAVIWLATLISNVLGVLWNFVTTGTLVFENKDKTLIWRFVACYVINYFINTGSVYAFEWMGLSPYWAGLLATPVAALCSFFLLKFLVFRK